MLRDARQRGDRKLLNLVLAKIMDLANMTRTVPQITSQRALPVVPGATSALKGPEPVVSEPLKTRTYGHEELLPTPPTSVENASQAKNIYRYMLREGGKGLKAPEGETVVRPLRERGQVVGAEQLEDLAMAIDARFVRGSRNRQQIDRGRELSRHLVEKYDQLEQQAKTREAELAGQRGVEGFEAVPGSELQSGKAVRVRAGEQRLHTEEMNEYVDELYRRRGEIEDELMHLEWGEKKATTEADLHVDRDLKVRVERLLPALPGGRLVLRDGRKKSIPAQDFDSRAAYDFAEQEFTVGGEKIPLHMVTGVEQARANLKFQGREVTPDELLWVLQKVRGEAKRLRDEGAKRKRPTMSEADWNEVRENFLDHLPDEALGALSGYMRPVTPAAGTEWADFPSPVWGGSADYRSTQTSPNYNLQRAIWETQRARARGERLDKINKGELPRGARAQGMPERLDVRTLDGKVRGKMSGVLAADPYLNVQKSNKVLGFPGVHGKLRTFIQQFLELNWRIPTHPSEPYVEATTKGFKVVGDYTDMLGELSNRDFDLVRPDGEAMSYALDEMMQIMRTPGSAEDVAAALNIPKSYVTDVKKALTKQRKYWRTDQTHPSSKMTQIMLDLADRVARTREGTPWEDVAPEPDITVETTKKEREVGAFNVPRVGGRQELEAIGGMEEAAEALAERPPMEDVQAIIEPTRSREISLDNARRLVESALTAFETDPKAFTTNEAGEITDMTAKGEPGSLARLAQLVRDAKPEWTAKGEMTWDSDTAHEAHAYATALRRYLERNYPGVPNKGLEKAYAGKGTPRADQLLESEMTPEHYAVSKAAVEQREAGAEPGTPSTTPPRRYQMNAIARQLREVAFKEADPKAAASVIEAAESILDYGERLRRHEEYVAKQHTTYLKYRKNLSKKLRDAGRMNMETGEVMPGRRTRDDMLKQERKRLDKYFSLARAYSDFVGGLLKAEQVLGRKAMMQVGLGEGRDRGTNMLAFLEHMRNPTAETKRAVDSVPIETKDFDAVDVKLAGDTPEVAVEAPKKGWHVEPASVEWGPVFDTTGADVSTTHVLVRYKGGENQYVPHKAFFNNVKRSIMIGKDLGIEFMRVSPEVMQHYARVGVPGAAKWDKQIGEMTDWREVGKTYAKLLAYTRAVRGQQLREMEQTIGAQVGRVPKEAE
jgi:hypothetical protein